MKIKAWLKQAEAQLNEAGVGSARLDALILLEDELGKDRSWVLANPDFEISKTALKRLNYKLKKRESHLPLSYVRGFTEFYGRKFMVNRHVLEPRPESEVMITLLKNLLKHQNLVSKDYPWKIADVGCGSGALGITAKLELPNTEVDLFDIDAGALSVARHNQVLHELHLHTRKADLLRRPLRPYDVILANLPYVPDQYKINQAAAMEPRIAIFGGKDGLDVYRRFFAQLQYFTTDVLVQYQGSEPRLERRGWKPKFVLTEALPPQHEKLAEIANQNGFRLYESKEFIQVFKNS